jgi:hypothetical protein
MAAIVTVQDDEKNDNPDFPQFEAGSFPGASNCQLCVFPTTVGMLMMHSSPAFPSLTSGETSFYSSFDYIVGVSTDKQRPWSKYVDKGADDVEDPHVDDLVDNGAGEDWKNHTWWDCRGMSRDAFYSLFKSNHRYVHVLRVTYNSPWDQDLHMLLNPYPNFNFKESALSGWTRKSVSVDQLKRLPYFTSVDRSIACFVLLKRLQIKAELLRRDQICELGESDSYGQDNHQVLTFNTVSNEFDALHEPWNESVKTTISLIYRLQNPQYGDDVSSLITFFCGGDTKVKYFEGAVAQLGQQNMTLERELLRSKQQIGHIYQSGDKVNVPEDDDSQSAADFCRYFEAMIQQAKATGNSLE